MSQIKQIIETKYGMSWDEITGKSRKQKGVFVRMILARKWCESCTQSEIGTLLNRNHASIWHYLNRYDIEYEMNKEFRQMAEL